MTEEDLPESCFCEIHDDVIASYENLEDEQQSVAASLSRDGEEVVSPPEEKFADAIPPLVSTPNTNTSMDNTVDAAVDGIEALRAELRLAQQAIAKHESRFNETADASISSPNVMAEISSMRECIKTEITMASAQRQVLLETVDKQQQEISRLQAQNSDLESHCMILENELQTASESLDTDVTMAKKHALEQIIELENALAAAEVKTAEARAEVRAATVERDEARIRARELKADLDEATKKHNSLADAMLKLQKTNAELLSDCEALQEQVLALQTDQGTLSSRLDAERERATQAETALHMRTEELAQSERGSGRMKSDAMKMMESMAMERSAHAEALARATADKEALQAVIASLREELATARSVPGGETALHNKISALTADNEELQRRLAASTALNDLITGGESFAVSEQDPRSPLPSIAQAGEDESVAAMAPVSSRTTGLRTLDTITEHLSKNLVMALSPQIASRPSEEESDDGSLSGSRHAYTAQLEARLRASGTPASAGPRGGEVVQNQAQGRGQRVSPVRPKTAGRTGNARIVSAAIRSLLANSGDEGARTRALEALNGASKSGRSQFAVLLAGVTKCAYKAVYAVNADGLIRLDGSGPELLPAERISNFYRYESGQREFVEVKAENGLDQTVAAVVIARKRISG
ncbi:Microtubule-binding calmodulin-regulated spectrin-associated [Carpediemonas membranifera]|uniref:Microtubule-binding calmodulin-regulated spectrin-associated n=1 Tax=Carpediemonas membranifera TaxID=201153 RepID=A0A8J6B803_9EUKA|nr:Microtubule-binding calmodulin-regulated spectrin-associated [Carpediemonas membranifera]|eukprot:KAG9397518.1 Microtubule-binding calmodulin-regulated spectrin-associated [Carpediemonas membranifera]